jgi:hypothetical protein
MKWKKGKANLETQSQSETTAHLRYLTEKYKGKTVILSNGLTGEIVEVVSYKASQPEIGLDFIIMIWPLLRSTGKKFKLSIDQIMSIEEK